MLPPPILNVRLRACAEDWHQMTPAAQGRHCAHCDRVVIDFTQATQPDLEAAFRTAPDGRVCGRFQPEQLAADQPAPLPRRVALRPKLRRFLVALALVCGLGLSGREAVAQVRKVVPRPPVIEASEQNPTLLTTYGGLVFYEYEDTETPVRTLTGQEIFTYVEQMPIFRGGNEDLKRFIAGQVRQPKDALYEGRVFVKFVIDEQGQVTTAQILRGLNEAADTEALRVVRLLPPFTPGRQNGRTVKVSYTVRISFGGDE
ncbi:energy transducer TonB [Hymenobacter rubripertinctus]|uniref:Energy transducer TonB n=1 Tax=Hymenobacter rubripertinctus TaxID=2029981 RepID=A0A418QPV0_9BACT|nr:energy transducer TonB [Hymenobacter rubripertinctus]RIY07070.1 energy transducer TonB [Hymenobacter rubripertinctus]